MNSTEEKDSKGNIDPKYLFDLLDEGAKKIKISDAENAVFIIGNTGAGKSTLAQFISGNGNLTSVETTKHSGDYIIVDSQNKISGNSTIVSYTLFPELIFDSETNTTYYDCPGFSDTRSAAHDIAATYFTKKVIDSVKAVKFMIVVNYSSVRVGVDRKDFMELLKHISTFIPNVEKFRQNMALVVTKVENNYIKQGGQFTLVKDNTVIDGIANFLNLAKNDLKTMERTEFTDNALILIDIFSEKKENAYSKIAIFRRPDEEGPLSNITLLQSNKKVIKNVVNNNIGFIVKNNTDFRLTVSADSLNSVYECAKTINSGIAVELVQLGENIESKLEQQEVDHVNIYMLTKNLKSGNELFSDVERLATQSPTELVDRIIGHFEQLLSPEIVKKCKHQVETFEHYFHFLQEVSNKSLAEPLLWLNGLKSLKEYVSQSWTWYDFLINLYNSLSDYKIQRHIKEINIESVIKAGESQGDRSDISLNLHNLLKNMTSISGEHNLEDMFGDVQINMVSKMKLKYLMNLLSFFTEPTQLNISYGRLIVKGNVVMLSDVINDTRYGEVTGLEIMASTKLFIDVDVSKVGSMQLSILAPTWEVVGMRKTINLVGKPGEDQGKAYTGRVGNPGYPGGPGGNFYGVAASVIGGKLVISSRGGKGGCGEDGGDGIDGTAGEDAPAPRDRVTKPVWDEWNPGEDFDRKGFKWDRLDSSEIGFVGWYGYICYGTPATDGSNAGDGGVGGKGGSAGHIAMTDLSNSSNVVVFREKGKDGEPGSGGKGGNSAKNGDDLKVFCRADRYVLVSVNYCDHTSRVDKGWSNSGSSGRDGNNHEGIKDREPPVPLSYVDAIVIEYKAFLQPIVDSDFSNHAQFSIYSYNESVVRSGVKFNSKRKRRNAKFLSVDPPVSSSASSLKNSFIPNILYKAVSTTLELIYNKNPMDFICSIFKPSYIFARNTDEPNQSISNFNFLTETFNKQDYLHSQFKSNAMPIEAHGFPDQALHMNNIFSLPSPNDLLLWDLVVRTFSGEKYATSVEKHLPERNEYSHDLAYRHYSMNL